jgi:predicted ribosome quality control (RQC) complex YloA/Tae2 family protein
MKRMVQVSKAELPAEIGYDGMKAVAQLKTPEEQQEALQALKTGYSQDMLREEFSPKRSSPAAEDPAEALSKEKQRIMNTIAKLNQRLEEIDQELGASGSP